MKTSLMWLIVFWAPMVLGGMGPGMSMPPYNPGMPMGGMPPSMSPGVPSAPPAVAGQCEAMLKSVRDKLVGHKQQLQNVKGLIKSFVRTRKANLPDQQAIKKMIQDMAAGIAAASASVKESVLPDPVELKQLVSSIKKSKDAAAVKVVQDWLGTTLAKGQAKTSEAIAKLNQEKIDEAVKTVRLWLKNVAKSFGGGLENTSEQLDGWFGTLAQGIDDLDKVASGQSVPTPPSATTAPTQPVVQPSPMPMGPTPSALPSPMPAPMPISPTPPVTPPPSPMPSGPGAPVKR